MVVAARNTIRPVPEPLGENLAAFLESLEPADWSVVKQRCLDHPRGNFLGDDDYAALALRLGDMENERVNQTDDSKSERMPSSRSSE